MKKRQILMTSAMLYANGSLHLGHMVELVQADIWARFQRMRGHDIIYVAGEDAHGTPIMINAEKQGMDPEDFIAKYAAEHQADFKDFLISLDEYYTTHSKENQALSD
ncbi:MAG: class I tRNA ligase family protein, partial [Pseudomonadota bacterium]